MFSIVRIVFKWIVYLLLAIIPFVCGYFSGMYREIIAAGGDWDEIIKLIAGGYFGKLIISIITIFVATWVIRFILAFFIDTDSKWNYLVWIFSSIIGIVISVAFSGFKLSFIIGLVIGIILDAIVFGLIAIIISIDENLSAIHLHLLTNTSSNLNSIKNTDSNDTKKCPFCAEQIKREANICRFCNREVRTEL
jgi:hypothetical protein